MRVNHSVYESVESDILIDGDCADGLFAHGRLICIPKLMVGKTKDNKELKLSSYQITKDHCFRTQPNSPGTLVVMGVRDEPCHHAKQRHRIDFEMSVRHPLHHPTYLQILGDGAPPDLQLSLGDRDQAIVLLVNVDVFHDALTQEVLNVDGTQGQTLDVDLPQPREGGPVVDYDEGPADAAAVGGDVHRPLPVMEVYANELAHLTLPSQRAKAPNKPYGTRVRA